MIFRCCRYLIESIDKFGENQHLKYVCDSWRCGQTASFARQLELPSATNNSSYFSIASECIVKLLNLTILLCYNWAWAYFYVFKTTLFFCILPINIFCPFLDRISAFFLINSLNRSSLYIRNRRSFDCSVSCKYFSQLVISSFLKCTYW